MNEMTANPLATLLPVSFHSDTVFLTEYEGQPYVPLRPIVENLGLAWKPQFSKLKANLKRWSCVTIKVTQVGDIQRREVVCIPLKKFFAFLLSIEPSKVKPEIRDRVEMYQTECDEVLWRHWSGEEEQLASEERLRRIVREELATFTPPRKAALSVKAAEAAAIKADILDGARVCDTARKYNRSVSTIQSHTVEQRAHMREQAAQEQQAGLFDTTNPNTGEQNE